MSQKTRTQVFAENLERVRKAKGYSRKTLADVVGVNAISFSAYERGLREPSLDKIFKLADFLEVPVTELTGNSKKVAEDENSFKKEFFRALRLLTLAGCQIDPRPDNQLELNLIREMLTHGAAYVPFLTVKNECDLVEIFNYIEEEALRNNRTFYAVLEEFVKAARYSRDRIIVSARPLTKDEVGETKEEYLHEVQIRMDNQRKSLAEFIKNGGKLPDDLSDEEREIMESHIKRGKELLGDLK